MTNLTKYGDVGAVIRPYSPAGAANPARLRGSGVASSTTAAID